MIVCQFVGLKSDLQDYAKTAVIPTRIKLDKNAGQLELSYADGSYFVLSGEYLRVHSPSAEVRGHGPGQEVLQYGKRGVKITDAERAGNYALRLVFSDGHDSGIYTWDYLFQLGAEREALWQAYLQKLRAAKKFRDPDTIAVKLVD